MCTILRSQTFRKTFTPIIKRTYLKECVDLKIYAPTAAYTIYAMLGQVRSWPRGLISE